MSIERLCAVTMQPKRTDREGEKDRWANDSRRGGTCRYCPSVTVV